ncbi:MAG TPA: LysR substrate-binding domain-containing protein [Gaiellaceae bacterium]
MQLELRHLRYFLAVADELNFSRAAERLHVAQPALSAQIKAFETLVGCELFRRTTRKVELTTAGELLVPEAREIVGRADEALVKLGALARTQGGSLRIGFVAHAAGETGLEILRRLHEGHPAIEADLVESRTLEGLQQAVVDRETDATFAWLPIIHEELDSQPVLSERKLVGMHPEHRLATKRAVEPDDLVDEPIITPWERYSPETLAYWLAPFREGRKEFDVYAESVDNCLNLVSLGVGVYCVPESVERFYGRPDVVFRPLAGVEPAGIALAWRRDTDNPAVAKLVEVTRAVIQSRRQ